METQIRFLEDLEEDLLEAAWRETLGREAARRPRRRGRIGSGRPRRRWVLVSAGAAASLVLAGSIGWFVLGTSQSGGHGFLPFTTVAGGDAEQSAGGAPTHIGSFGLDRRLRLVTPEEALATDEQQSGGGGSGFLPQAGTPELTKVIKTADISLVIGRGTFTESFEEVQAIASRHGGFVVSSTTRGTRSGTLLIRVNARDFDAAMSDLRSLGTRVERQRISGEDVTADFIDLKARLEIAQDRKQALAELLDRATSIESILRLQNVIEGTQVRIEEMQGRIRFINNQTSKATIRVSLRESGVLFAPESPVRNPRLGRAFELGIAGFFAVLSAVMIGVGYLIPTAVVVAGIWLLVRVVRRRRAAV